MTDITELAQSHELLIANGNETEAELSITDFALRAAGYVDELVEALESKERIIQVLESSYNEQTEALEKAQQHIADLESRTVKLPDPIDNKYWRNDWDATHFIYSAYVNDLKAELSTKGIKWEAE